jgi:hypothetical protein
MKERDFKALLLNRGWLAWFVFLCPDVCGHYISRKITSQQVAYTIWDYACMKSSLQSRSWLWKLQYVRSCKMVHITLEQGLAMVLHCFNDGEVRIGHHFRHLRDLSSHPHAHACHSNLSKQLFKSLIEHHDEKLSQVPTYSHPHTLLQFTIWSTSFGDHVSYLILYDLEHCQRICLWNS